MQAQIDPILQRIANQIISVIDADWSAIILTGEAADGSLELDCRYKFADKPEEEETFFAPSEVLLNFLRLRFMIKGQSGKSWDKFRFVLYPDGNFDIEFTYPTENER